MFGAGFKAFGELPQDMKDRLSRDPRKGVE